MTIFLYVLLATALGLTVYVVVDKCKESKAKEYKEQQGSGTAQMVARRVYELYSIKPDTRCYMFKFYQTETYEYFVLDVENIGVFFVMAQVEKGEIYKLDIKVLGRKK